MWRASIQRLGCPVGIGWGFSVYWGFMSVFQIIVAAIAIYLPVAAGWVFYGFSLKRGVSRYEDEEENGK